jgi:hypothetical protein
MTARLAIEAEGASDRNARRGACDAEAHAAAARYRERLSMPRLIEAMGTLATMASFLFALGLIAGEWLGDAGVIDVADAVARTMQVAMPHVAEGSSTAAAAGS